MECILIEFNEVVPDSLEGERLDRLIAFIGNISRSEAVSYTHLTLPTKA